MGSFLAQVYHNLTMQAYFWLSRGNHDYAILFLLSYMPFIKDSTYKEYTFHKIISLSISQKQELFFKLLTTIHSRLIEIMTSLNLKEIQIENTYTDISFPNDIKRTKRKNDMSLQFLGGDNNANTQ